MMYAQKYKHLCSYLRTFTKMFFIFFHFYFLPHLAVFICSALYCLAMMEDNNNQDEGSSKTIQNLQGRLARRNDLLDVIRKAYHRDVLAIKEYLLGAEKEGRVIDTTVLSSLPSIDLREGGFRLFAPQECELRVRPCHDCGGQLEIIHRESTRIVQYRAAIQQMEENETDLRIELLDAKSQAKKDRDRLVDEMQRSQNERFVLTNQIKQLKSQLSNRNAEVELLTEEKAHLELTLEQQQPIVLDHQRLVVERQKETKESRRWEANFHEEKQKAVQFQHDNSLVLHELRHELNQTQRTNEQFLLDLQKAVHRCKMFEERSSNLANELSESQLKVKELVASLQLLVGLKSILAHDREQMSNDIHELEDKCSELTSRVNELDDLSQNKALEAESYITRIKIILESAKERGSISTTPTTVADAFLKADELISDYETVRQKSRTLSHLLISCIRAVYESCIVQENILRVNDSELHKNEQIKPLVDTTNKITRKVMEHLENADKSDAIDWQYIINNEDDRNHVLGNLFNRQQIGQFSLDKAFEKERQRHIRILRKCHHVHEKETEKRLCKSQKLEQQLSEATIVIRKYEEKMIKIQQKYALGVVPLLMSTQDLLLNVRKEFTTGDNTFSKLREECKEVTGRLLDALRVSREKIRSLNITLEQRVDDVSARDAAINHFEGMLSNITHRYAENERKHNKVTQEMSVQASAAVTEASTYADFLPLSLDKRLVVQEENKPPCVPSALLPGRIFQIRENLQFRRALDKL